ncbi:MAG: DUF5682 family protein [Blastocatellia bacterium]
MSIHIFGIRHHGPGSARSLHESLVSLRPDAILIEGPPDAESVLPFFADKAMRPPVALLIYAPEEPNKAVFYPFAEFSPEWQAARYGLQHGVAVRFMDLPQTHQFALSNLASEISNSDAELPRDPLGELSEAAGNDDGEGWWEQIIEQRRNSADVFAAIAEAMTVLREPHSTLPHREALREAFMRQTIRVAEKEGFEKIAVVCGAWHVPALQTMPPVKEDAALLKSLPKTKVAATWIPWTNGRLSYASGYGAGITSPGWYSHLWRKPEQTEIRWLTKVARLLRKEDLDASSASVIEAVRLAETLAAMRGQHRPGLRELNEATQTVLCFGNDAPLRLIHEKLIVGEVLGEVPEDMPAVPLQQDLQRKQKRLRFPAEATQKTIDLDLRKENDLARSQLLHRLSLLGIAWGEPQRAGGNGTFHELWRVQWQPEFSVALIEAGIWGNTVLEAATNLVKHKANKAENLAALTALVDHTLLADLPAAVAHLMARIQAEAAVASDIAHLLDALPPLANVMRYGNVRQTDTATVGKVVDGLVARICVGLPNACASLNDDAATAMYDRLVNVNGALALLQQQEHLTLWQSTLAAMSEQQTLHGLIAGRCCRLLFEAQVFAAEETARRLSFALSTASEPAQAAAWMDGFLRGSGLLLLHDEALWQVIDEWVVSLPSETFTQLLPLLRRTFATFAAPERRQMGERVAQGTSVRVAVASGDFDVTRAEAVLPLLRQLLGINYAE